MVHRNRLEDPSPRPPSHRDVSPMGASRFERPYSPPRSYNSSATTSPATPISTSLNMPFGNRKSRIPNAADSMISHRTMDTAPTSISSDEHVPVATRKESIENSSPIVTPDDWFAQFRSEEDLSTQSDECPDRATLAAVHDIPIYDAEGNARPFGSLYDPTSATHERQLLIFVRHFYCGACQAYLKAMTESINMREYFSIPIPTSIIVIGCGQPNLIPHYKTFTQCPFPMFADPTRALFKKLGMAVTASIGKERPEYMRDISAAAWAAGQVTTISKSLRDPEGIRKRDVLKGGMPLQVGGEFLFEDGRVIWCHRMKNMRGHAEIKVVRKILGLDE